MRPTKSPIPLSKRARAFFLLLATALPALAQGPAGLDPFFNAGNPANGGVTAASALWSGKIVIVGEFNMYAGATRNNIARLNADGTLDSTYQPLNLPSGSRSVVVDESAYTVIGGSFSGGIRKFWNDGTPDNSFTASGGASGEVYAVARDYQGRLLVGGTFTTINGSFRTGIAALYPNGQVDTSFNPPQVGSVTSLAVQWDGQVLVGGYNGVRRLNWYGLLDPSFNLAGAPNNAVLSIATTPGGKILIAGGFTTVGGVARQRIAQLNIDGTLDTGFNPGGADNGIRSVAVQADGKILIGGDFTMVNGVARNRIARLNANGSLDTGFDPGSGLGGPAYTVVLQPDGKALVGGYFSSYNGTPRANFLRLWGDRPPRALLGATSVQENAPAGTLVGSLTTTDPNGATVYSFALVAGEGDTDNASFAIQGSTLKTAAPINFETGNQRFIRVRSTAPGGAYGEDIFAITILDANDAPLVSQPLVDQPASRGAAFAHTFAQNTFTDPDVGQSLAYTAAGLPPGITFDGASRTFGGVPTVNGVFSVTVTATDNGVPVRSISDVMLLTVANPPAPIITTPPANVSVFEHQNATLSVTVTGVGLTYQWRKNGQDIPGATASPLVLTDVPAHANGQYSVVVSNAGGSVTSSAAQLTILAPAYLQNIADSLTSELATKATQSSLASLQTSFGNLVNTSVGSRASQTSLDAVQSLVSTNLDTNVLSRASQASVNTANATLATLDGKVDASVTSRASQTSVNSVATGVTNLGSTVATRASQASVDSANSSLTGLNENVSAVGSSVVTAKATVVNALQNSSQALTAAIDTAQGADQAGFSSIMTKLSLALDTNLLSRAAQASIDDLATNTLVALSGNVLTRASQATVEAIKTKLDGLDFSQIGAGTLATQASVDSLRIGVNTANTRLDTNIGSRSSQAAVDSLQISANAIITKLDTATHASQTSVDTANARLDVAVGTRASQAGLDALQTLATTGLDTNLASRASQATVDTIKTKVDALDLSQLDASVSSRATQGSVDSLQTGLNIANTKLDANIGSRSSQTAVDSLQVSANEIITKLDTANHASQSSVDAANAKLDVAVGTRASQAGLSALQTLVTTGLDTNVASRSSQATVDTIKTKIDALDLSRLDATVSSRATQSSVDSVKARVDSFDLGRLDQTVSSRASEATAQAIQTKANTLALESTAQAIKTKVETLSFPNLDAAISSRASQASVTAVNSVVTNRLDTNLVSRASQASLAALETLVKTNEQKAEEFRDLILRESIEAGLAAGATRERVALNYLPGSVGGQLEFVRDIVVDNIRLHQSAGLSLGKAQTELNKGNDAYAKKQWRDAYDQYRKSYLELIH